MKIKILKLIMKTGCLSFLLALGLLIKFMQVFFSLVFLKKASTRMGEEFNGVVLMTVICKDMIDSIESP